MFHHTLLNFMTEYGRAYLASGGPTSRLEESLSALGRSKGYPTEIFATPTGVFVSCVDKEGGSHTALSRIKEGGINLDQLCWLEQLLDKTLAATLSLDEANQILLNPASRPNTYSFEQTLFATFLAGFALSFAFYGQWVASIASGFIAMATWWVSADTLKKHVSSSIFRDFVGCAVTLGLSACCQIGLPVAPAPFEAYAIGGLIVLVPGLALTTAISELADQNLVSGTAKLMQAMLTLLAMGLVYFMFQEISSAMGLTTPLLIVKRPLTVGVAILSSVVSVSCFGVIFKSPRRCLPWATLTGVVAWLILREFSHSHYIIAASFLASLAVGLCSMTLGSWFKVPSQVFSVPGIIAMLPGMMALTSLSSFAKGNEEAALELGFKVALTAGSIVFGLFTARIPFAILGSRFKRAAMLARRVRVVR